MYIELKHSHKRKTMSEIEEKPYPSWVWDDTLIFGYIYGMKIVLVG